MYLHTDNHASTYYPIFYCSDAIPDANQQVKGNRSINTEGTDEKGPKHKSNEQNEKYTLSEETKQTETDKQICS